MNRDLTSIASQFDIDGIPFTIRPYGNGHIHDTYLICIKNPKGALKRAILQRINQKIFQKPHDLMHNILTVTRHLSRKILAEGGDPDRETLTVIPTKKGEMIFESCRDEAWRAYAYIEKSCIASAPMHLKQVGRAFARFQQRIADLPVDSVIETLPGFHDTVNRYRLFHSAVEKDPHNRACNVKKEIDFAHIREKKIMTLADLIDRRVFMMQINHNDTKLNNVLIDQKTNQALCVIDLDTVMPGPLQLDFGDCVRSGANSAAEDEKDLSKVFFDMHRFELLTNGYLEVAASYLSKVDRQALVDFAWLVTIECGIRFLTDYLLGDVYFKIHRPDHNRDRCRVHFKLLEDLEHKMDRMFVLVEKLTASEGF